MSQPWEMMLQIAYLAVFMFIAMIIRQAIPGFYKFRIPDAIVAGLLALIAGPSILNLIPLDTVRLTTLVYHLLAIGFIALSLKRDTTKGRGRTALSAGLFNVVSYCVQGFVGLGITLILISTLYPKLFPAFGLLLPFGFAQGPMAGEMAVEWAHTTSPEGLLAFPSVTTAASVGFSFSTLGFLWACLVGVPLMNLLIRRRKRRGEPMPGLVSRKPKPNSMTADKESLGNGLGELVDSSTTQLILIGIVYVLLFLFLKGLSWALFEFLGTGGITKSLVGIFWSIHFVLGAIIATFLGKIIHKLEDRQIFKHQVINNNLQQRIGGAAVDFMIAASIAAIDVRVLAEGNYIVPILIVTTLGGFSVILYTWFLVTKVWPKTYVEHFVAFFGEQTGTIATGLALLRGVDPEFRTRAASDIVYGSALAVPFVLPLIFVATLPIEGFETGNHKLYWISLLLVLGYLVLTLVIWFLPPVFRFLTRYSKTDTEEQEE